MLAERLNKLFNENLNPDTGRPFTNQDVANQVLSLTSSNLSRLRSGKSSNPSYKTILGLCEFFAVSPSYFFPEEYVVELSKDQIDIQKLASQIAEDVTTSIATRMGLSREKIDKLRD